MVDGRLTFGQLVAFAMGLRVADFNEEDDPEAQELEKRARASGSPPWRTHARGAACKV